MVLLLLITAGLALFAWFFLSFNTFAMVGIVILCLSGILLKYALVINQRLLGVLSSLCILGIILIAGIGGTRDFSWDKYNKDVVSIYKKIGNNDLDGAKQQIETLDEQYGSTDLSKMLWAYFYTETRDYPSALEAMDVMNDRTSEEWFKCRESVYLSMNNSDSEKMLQDLYENAVNENPRNAYFQMMEGVECLKKDRYDEAQYHLLKAYLYEPDNGIAAYYLGVVAFKTADYRTADLWFRTSEEIGVNVQYQKDLEWYKNVLSEKM